MIQKLTQTEKGKAFEYAIAKALAISTNAPLIDNSSLSIAKAAYNKHPESIKYWLEKAANESSNFLYRHEKGLEKAKSIYLQNDNVGILGDVRDITISVPKNEIGISAKHQHKAIKHSRLSDKIDFGKVWTDYPCSPQYMKAIQPVFHDMRQQKALGTLFKNIEHKELRYYLPVLTAFEGELNRLCRSFGQLFVKRLFRYLLGKYDFYKVTYENKSVSIQSINLDGSLELGKRWKIPDTIDAINRKSNSQNTILVTFSGGWQISFRIHNASSRVELSLKFDIQFVGLSQDVARHEIKLDL